MGQLVLIVILCCILGCTDSSGRDSALPTTERTPNKLPAVLTSKRGQRTIEVPANPSVGESISVKPKDKEP